MKRKSLPLLEFSTLAVVVLGSVVAVVPGADQYILNMLDGSSSGNSNDVLRMADVAPEFSEPIGDEPNDFPERFASLEPFPATSAIESEINHGLESLPQPAQDQLTASTEHVQQDLMPSLSPASDVEEDFEPVSDEPAFENEIQSVIESPETESPEKSFEDEELELLNTPRNEFENPMTIVPEPVVPTQPESAAQPKKSTNKFDFAAMGLPKIISAENQGSLWTKNSLFSGSAERGSAESKSKRIIQNPLIDQPDNGPRINSESIVTRIKNDFFGAPENAATSTSQSPTTGQAEPLKRQPMSSSKLQSEDNSFPPSFPQQ